MTWPHRIKTGPVTPEFKRQKGAHHFVERIAGLKCCVELCLVIYVDLCICMFYENFMKNFHNHQCPCLISSLSSNIQSFNP